MKLFLPPVLLTILSALTLVSCSTTEEIKVQARTIKGAPAIRRFNIITPSSMSASSINPVTKKTSQWNHYHYSALLFSRKDTFFTIDFTDGRTEVYNLKECGLKRRQSWSPWIAPQSIVKKYTPNGGSNSFHIMNNIKETSRASDSTEKYSQFRFTLEKWDL